MTTPPEPPETPAWNVPTPAFRLLADWLVQETPAMADELTKVINAGTGYDEAADRIAAEAVLAISFGLIARLPARDRDLAKDIGTMRSMRAFGQDPGAGVWAHLHQLVIEHIDGAEHVGVEGAGLTALGGLLAATQPEAPENVRDAIDAAVHAWDQAVHGQHAAVMFWVNDIAITHTKRAGEAQHGGQDAAGGELAGAVVGGGEAAELEDGEGHHEPGRGG